MLVSKYAANITNITKYCTHLIDIQYLYTIHNVSKYCTVGTVKGHWTFFFSCFKCFDLFNCILGRKKKSFFPIYSINIVVLLLLLKPIDLSEFEILGSTTGKEWIPAGWDCSNEVIKICLFDETAVYWWHRKFLSFPLLFLWSSLKPSPAKYFHLEHPLILSLSRVVGSPAHLVQLPTYHKPPSLSCVLFFDWSTMWIWLEWTLFRQTHGLGTVSHFFVCLW